MKRDRWLGIELRHFAALDAIAKERSFRGAAARLGYVQSAISRQIAFLEQATGVRLIERSQGPRPVHLTEAGHVLLAHADDILARITAAKSDLGELSGGRTGDIRVGVFSGVPTRVLPQVVPAFCSRCPDVTVAASEAPTDVSLVEQLQEGCIDLAFVNLPLEPGPLVTRELIQVPWVLVVGSDTEWGVRASPPALEEIARLSLIVLKPDRLGLAIESRLRSGASLLHVVFRADLVETALALVKAGIGAAVLPALAVEDQDPRLTAIELGDLLPPSRIGLAWHRDRKLGPAVVAFRDVAAEICKAISFDDRRRATQPHDRWHGA